MKIGFYGGIANNMYVFAKALSTYDRLHVHYIRDRSDKYPISQPLWEDCAFEMHYEVLSQAKNWSWEKWTLYEQEQRWEKPKWVQDPNEMKINLIDVINLNRLPLLDYIWTKRYLAAPHRMATLNAMKSCDGLLVCGVEGCILALLSGKPYIIWPHGGDSMIAAGLFQPSLRHLRQRIAHGVIVRHLKKAFDKAICVGSHEPTGILHDYLGAENYLKKLPVVFMPIPIPVRIRPSPEIRRAKLANLLSQFGISTAGLNTIGFVPSRVDYKWKGQDRLLKAIANKRTELKNSGIKFLFSGWGDDLLQAKKFTEDNGISDTALFLNVALSKPMLFQFYEAVDFAVDQFILGMYGTAALEAMAAGCPLMTWLSDEYERPWGVPPVINVQTTEDIMLALDEIATGERDLEVVSSKLQGWMANIHSPDNAMNIVISAFEKTSSTPRGW
jgi:glycosyltransferase involved in cell wall biosynthesis